MMQTIQSGGRRKPLRTGLTISMVVGFLLLSAPTLALAGAGLKPSEAPLVTVGQHYFGNMGHASNAGRPVDLWRLPPLLTSDAITVAWHAPRVTGPVLCLAQNVDDYDWAEVDNLCNGSGQYFVASNGSARTVINAESSTSSAFLEVSSYSGDEDPEETYDFVVESIQHAIGISLNQTFHIRQNGVITAHANLADGSPVPDGLTFYLNVRARGYRAQYQTTSNGGTLSFPLTLPASTIGQTVALNVTRPADANYLRASSSGLRAKVARAKPRAHRRHHRRHHRRASRVATASAVRLTPVWVTDEISRDNNFIAHQHGFTDIRPKKASEGGDWVFIWGGPKTCRPGHDNNPLLYMYKDYVDRNSNGLCGVNGPYVRGGPHAPYPPDYHTADMNSISARVATSAGVMGGRGDTTEIQSDLKTATFTFRCVSAASNMIRNFTINKQGRRQAAQRCGKDSPPNS